MGEFWVGDRLVRPALSDIRVGVEKVHLEPRSMSVLEALAETPGEVVPKKKLIEKVWGDAFVSDEVLTHAIWDLRKAFGDKASNPEFIQTVPKKGYRLIAPVKRAQEEEKRRRKTDREPWYRSRRGLALVGALVFLGASVFWIAAQVRERERKQREEERKGQERERAFQDVLKDPLYADPDLEPWIDPDRHDPRAVQDFLLGMRYVYRNEVEGDASMDAAMARDPDFVAPRVFRTPGIFLGGDETAIQEHRGELERLYPSASGFEKASIAWALALIEGSPSSEVRHLKIALGLEPSNRIVRLNLGGARFRQKDYEKAWVALEPLLAQRWCFPGLFTLAARSALHRKSVPDAQAALKSALDCDPVDPEVLALLELLARYEGQQAEATRFAQGLERRVKEMAPEVFTFDPTGYLRLLEGEHEVARSPAIEENFR